MRLFSYSFIAIILFASCSDKVRAKRLLLSAKRDVEKAIMLDPSIADSVRGKKEVTIDVPEERGSIPVKPLLYDSLAFDRLFIAYDSLLMANELLKKQNSNTEDVKKEREKQISNNETVIKKYRDQFRKGFYKDSVYRYEDSVGVFNISIVEGKLSSIEYQIKKRTVSKDVETIDINLRPSLNIWKQSSTWILLLLILFLIVIIIFLLRRK
jgi:hypothetical protein